MKGWKMVLFAAALFVLGGLQSPLFVDAIGGCVFEMSATQPDTCTLPAWMLMPIAGLVFLLRAFTSTTMFSKK